MVDLCYICRAEITEDDAGLFSGDESKPICMVCHKSGRVTQIELDAAKIRNEEE